MKNSTCVITGVSSGIGSKVAEIFSETGCEVLGISRRMKFDAKCSQYFSSDLTDPSQLERVAKSIMDSTKKVDYLIHCAGVMPTQPAHTLKWEGIKTPLLLNIGAPIYLTSMLTKPLARAKGCVIFVSSVASILNIRGELVYSATKSAVNKLAEDFAAEMSPLGIRCFCVQPNICNTPMTSRLDENAIEYMSSKSLLRRSLDPMEVAQTIHRASQLSIVESGSTLGSGGVIK